MRSPIKRDRQTDRQRQKQRQRQTDRQTDREMLIIFLRKAQGLSVREGGGGGGGGYVCACV